MHGTTRHTAHHKQFVKCVIIWLPLPVNALIWQLMNQMNGLQWNRILSKTIWIGFDVLHYHSRQSEHTHIFQIWMTKKCVVQTNDSFYVSSVELDKTWVYVYTFSHCWLKIGGRSKVDCECLCICPDPDHTESHLWFVKVDFQFRPYRFCHPNRTGDIESEPNFR